MLMNSNWKAERIRACLLRTSTYIQPILRRTVLFYLVGLAFTYGTKTLNVDVLIQRCWEILTATVNVGPKIFDHKLYNFVDNYINYLLSYKVQTKVSRWFQQDGQSEKCETQR